MALTAEQLLTIKTKVETDKIRPIRAIKELFPNENVEQVRQQLFGAYDREELLSHVSNAPGAGLSKEQKLARVNEQLQNIEQRKEKLLQQKAELEN